MLLRYLQTLLKTFSIPATKSNNKVFKHYYNFDIVGGFDARLKTVGSIKLNGVDFKKGKIKLEGVDLKDNKPNAYRVTFFGDLVDLKDLIGEDLLSDLWWLDNAKEDGTGQPTFVREYSSEKIKDNLKGNDTTVSFINSSGSTETYLNAIKTSLISCTNRLYYDSGTSSGVDGNLWYHIGTAEAHQHGVYWEDLKYSIAVYVIVKAIEVKYNITFSSDFFDYSTEEYSSLMMLMHRKKGQAEADYSTGVRQYTAYVDTMGVQAGITSEDYTLNSVTYPLRVDSYNNRAEVSGFFATTPPTGWDRQYFYRVTLSPDDNQLFYSAYLYFNDSVVESVEGIQGQHEFSSIGGLGSSSNGNWSIRIESADTITFGTGRITWRFQFVETSTGIIQRSGTQKVNTSLFKVERKFDWLPSQQLPKMKVLDFLTGLWKMFNLTAYVENDGTIKVQKLDDFYANQSTDSPYDVTEFVDVNTSQVNVALPYKQINFRFKGNKTLLAAKFSQLNNREFATLEYKGENPNNWVGNEYKVELPFEKLVYERLSNDANSRTTTIMYGFMADDNQEPYIGSPLLHYTTLQSPTSEEDNRQKQYAVVGNAIGNLQNIFAAFGKESKALAIAGIVVEQVASISKIISNTGIANAKAVAASPLTFGQPFVGINSVSAGLSIAGSVAGAVKAISDLKSNKKSPSSASASSGVRSAAPRAPQAASFNLVGQGGTNQLAEAIGSQSQQPVRAYVVSGDVSTAQSLDRNIVESASL